MICQSDLCRFALGEIALRWDLTWRNAWLDHLHVAFMSPVVLASACLQQLCFYAYPQQNTAFSVQNWGINQPAQVCCKRVLCLENCSAWKRKFPFSLSAASSHSKAGGVTPCAAESLTVLSLDFDLSPIWICKQNLSLCTRKYLLRISPRETDSSNVLSKVGQTREYFGLKVAARCQKHKEHTHSLWFHSFVHKIWIVWLWIKATEEKWHSFCGI